MEPRFEVQTTISKDLMKHFARYSCTSRSVKIRRLLLLAFGCIELYLASLTGFRSIPAIVLGLLAVLLVVFYPQYLQWWYWRRNKPKAGTLYINTFFDDHFDTNSDTYCSSAQYSDIFEVQETKEAFGLKRDKGGAVLFPKSNFTVGTPDDFRVFLTEKTGKKIKFIR